MVGDGDGGKGLRKEAQRSRTVMVLASPLGAVTASPPSRDRTGAWREGKKGDRDRPPNEEQSV